MKQILILGGGVAGVQVALRLNKKYKNTNEVNITLVNGESYHLFHANLYEVATSPEELTSLSQLKKTVALPLKEIFKDTKVNFIQSKVTGVDTSRQEVFLGERNIKYDFLVLALGATNNFYNIPGAEEYSYTLQNIKGALQIRNRLEFLVQMHRDDMSKKLLRVVIAGGGFAGIELAAELKGYLDFLAWENGFPREKIETLIVEGANSILPGLPSKEIFDASERLKNLGVNIKTSSIVVKVDGHFLEFTNGEKITYDCLVWTAGVKANQISIVPETLSDRGGRIEVDSFLRIPKHTNVFVLGDQASIVGVNGKPVPGTAAQAINQASYVSKAVWLALQNKQTLPFKSKEIGYIIPLGGKWMMLKSGPLYFKGLLSFFGRELVFLHYFATVLGYKKAIKLLWLENKIYSKND